MTQLQFITNRAITNRAVPAASPKVSFIVAPLMAPLMTVGAVSLALGSSMQSAAVAYPSIGLEFDLTPASESPSAPSAPSSDNPPSAPDQRQTLDQSAVSSSSQTVPAPPDPSSTLSATASEEIPQFSEPTYQPEFPISPERLPVPEFAGNPPLAAADSQTFATLPPTPPYLEPSWLFAQQPANAEADGAASESGSESENESSADSPANESSENSTADAPSEPAPGSESIVNGESSESAASTTAEANPEKSSLPAFGSRPSIGFEIGQNEQVTIAAVPPDLMPSSTAKSSESASGQSENSANKSIADPQSDQSPASLPDKDLDSSSKAEAEPEKTSETKPISRADQIFAGKADSLVARAVGHAEGTRTISGERTPAYYGHNDPGNGKWNLGSFSYQHGASAPEVADELQLQRLSEQYQTLQQQAQQHNLEPSLAEDLNGLDLANQSPRAALGEAGYFARLAEAQTMGLRGEDAILWARTRSFLDPDTQQWNAPGLGNTLDGISRDQARRMNAIQQVLETAPASISVHPVTVTPNGLAEPVAPSAAQAPTPNPASAEQLPDTASRPNLPRLSAKADQPSQGRLYGQLYGQSAASFADSGIDSEANVRSHIYSPMDSPKSQSPSQTKTRTRADVIDRIFAFDAPA